MRHILLAGLLLGPALAPFAASPARAQIGVQTAGAQTAATLTPADQGWIDRIQDTLNGITTLKGRFQQIAPDGQRTTGTVWLDRPGRMRFAYDKPSPLLLVAGGGKLVFTDSALQQTTDIPLDRTPLGLLLRPSLSLSGDVTVTGFSHANGLLQVTLVKTASPSEGSLTVVLADGPLLLRGWRVVDAQGRETRIDLSDLTTGVPMPASLFDTGAASAGATR
jgi:outer membrane lipoprotein-sorting protein